MMNRKLRKKGNRIVQFLCIYKYISSNKIKVQRETFRSIATSTPSGISSGAFIGAFSTTHAQSGQLAGFGLLDASPVSLGINTRLDRPGSDSWWLWSSFLFNRLNSRLSQAKLLTLYFLTFIVSSSTSLSSDDMNSILRISATFATLLWLQSTWLSCFSLHASF